MSPKETRDALVDEMRNMNAAFVTENDLDVWADRLAAIPLPDANAEPVGWVFERDLDKMAGFVNLYPEQQIEIIDNNDLPMPGQIPLYLAPPPSVPAETESWRARLALTEKIVAMARIALEDISNGKLHDPIEYARQCVLAIDALAQPERESTWCSLVLGAAASLEDAANCMRDPDGKRAATYAAEHYRKRAKALSQSGASDYLCPHCRNYGPENVPCPRCPADVAKEKP